MATRAFPIVRLATLVVTLALSAALALGFFGWLHPAFDSFAHFRLHLAVLLFLSGIVLLGLRYWLHALIALLLSVGSVATTAPRLFAPLFGPVEAEATVPPGQPVYKLLQLNVFHGNPDPKAVLSLIARQHPDIVTLEEVTERWRGELDFIKIAYPYRLDCRAEPFGTVILSRRPMDKGYAAYCAPDGRLALAQVNLNGRNVEVLALHLPWPWPFNQARTIEAYAPALKMLGATALAAGDFNAAPWSASTRKVAQLGGFTRTERLGPTWIGHHGLPEAFKFVGLPIDQVMTKGAVVVHSTATLGHAGSDHLPIMIEFSLAPKEGETPPAQAVFAGLPSF